MVIGIDFDNTIVCCDDLFYKAALQKKLIPPQTPATKGEVRDCLRRLNLENAWIELQGYVYGELIEEASAFPDVREFFAACKHSGVELYIISHKTRHPFLGKSYDLHKAAYGWLEKNGFLSERGIGLPNSHVFFELTKADKLKRISATGCTHFIDDLPEFLLESSFPAGVERILFDPNQLHQDEGNLLSLASWQDIKTKLISNNEIQAKEPVDSQLFSKTSALLKKADIAGGVRQFIALNGGANNRIFRVETGQAPVLLKEYFRHPDDPRDRLNAEFSFSQYAWSNGIRAIPEPLASDPVNHIAIYEFIEAHPVKNTDVTESLIVQALQFFKELNLKNHQFDAQKLPTASEACFTIAEHLNCVERRLQMLKTINGASAIDREASNFIRNELFEAWTQTSDFVRRRSLKLGLDLESEIPNEDRKISPSDFGFHNALLEPSGKLRFIDFEYAGWDDPTKMVCDFFCQPAVPVPLKYYDLFMKSVAADLSDPDLFTKKISLLLPLYDIKWCCIFLNQFVPIGMARRRFAQVSLPAEKQKAQQLKKARLTLNRIKINQQAELSS